MAIRQIRVIGDEILRKECKPVTEMTDRTRELIEDMFETMYEAGGVGLAAPRWASESRLWSSTWRTATSTSSSTRRS